jgi:hypothetical protein
MLTSKILALVAGTSLSAGLMADQILEINSQLPVTGTAKTVISGFSFKNKEVTYEKNQWLSNFGRRYRIRDTGTGRSMENSRE